MLMRTVRSDEAEADQKVCRAPRGTEIVAPALRRCTSPSMSTPMSPLTTSMVWAWRQLVARGVDRIKIAQVGRAMRAIRGSRLAHLILVRVDVEGRRGARLGADEALDGGRAVLAGQPRVSTSRGRTVWLNAFWPAGACRMAISTPSTPSLRERVRGTRVMICSNADQMRSGERCRGLAWQAWARPTTLVPRGARAESRPSCASDRATGRDGDVDGQLWSRIGVVGKIRVASVPIEPIGQSSTKPRRRAERPERDSREDTT